MIYLPKVKTCSLISKTLNAIYDVYEEEIKKDSPQNIYIYKEFTDNENIMKELNALGIYVIEELSKLNPQDILIITYLGIDEDSLNYLNNNHIKYIDTTHSKIAKLTKLIKEEQEKNYQIIMVGNHELNTVHNINYVHSFNELNELSIKDNVFLSKMPTFNSQEFIKIANFLKDKTKNIFIYDNKYPWTQEFNDMLESCQHVKNVFSINYQHENYPCFYHLEDFLKYILENNYSNDEDYAFICSSDTPYKELLNYKYLLTFLLFYKKCYQEIKDSLKLFNKSLNVDDNKIIKDFISDFNDLNSDGKYIRGTLIALGKLLASDNTDNYVPLATAYETMESAILIHDDIIDNAKVRRGKPTIPKRICNTYLNKRKNNNYYQDTLKLANSVAICLGDYGLFAASKLISDSYQDNLTEILTEYNDIVIKTIKGEIIDVYLPFNAKYQFKETTEEDVLNIYHLKTSYYTIIGPVKLGYILANKELPKNIINILNNIGIAYQLKDDMLGILSNVDTLGKSTLSDIKEFKQTLLYSYMMKSEYKEEFLKYYGKNNLTKKEVKNIQELLIKAGAINYSELYLKDLYYNSLEEIDNLDIKEEYKALFKGLIIYLNRREK